MLPAFRQSRTKCRSSAKLSFFSFPGTFCRMFAAAPHIILYVNAGKEGQAADYLTLPQHMTNRQALNRVQNRCAQQGIGANKKYVRPISKYV